MTVKTQHKKRQMIASDIQRTSDTKTIRSRHETRISPDRHASLLPLMLVATMCVVSVRCKEALTHFAVVADDAWVQNVLPSQAETFCRSARFSNFTALHGCWLVDNFTDHALGHSATNHGDRSFNEAVNEAVNANVNANATAAATVAGDALFAASHYADNMHPALWFNDLFNRAVLPDAFVDAVPHIVATYIRLLILGTITYLICGGTWAWYIYVHKVDEYFPDKSAIPPRAMQIKQIKHALQGMFLYVTLPTFCEWLIENDYTMAYFEFSKFEWWVHILLTAGFMLHVEYYVYWAHRLLHHQSVYKYLHATHHQYIHLNDLSPWASVAFNPFDGMTQASPYVFTLFFIPIHFAVHLLLLFMTAIWATNIHDTLGGRTEPIMGAPYHTIHHLTFKDNFGQYTILFDWLFGTLNPPSYPHLAKGETVGVKTLAKELKSQ
eukprot:TRINITY_DN2079_c0_g1_i9.p1 TRINITY_DN2079_c0_g1~~TRINITY_DN2079_c0_g1_i9.p1  ORF type:complete len:438 (+),score=70.21 TRINITY_DN2079_c0_g1_i9:110-1423(+)